MKNSIAVSLLSLLFLTGCGADIEGNRDLSAANATYNGMKWAKQKFSADYVEAQSDSSISKECPFGDGFATVKAYATGGKLLGQGQCSTRSTSVGSNGCLTEEEFATKPVYVEAKASGCDKSIKEMPKLGK